MSNSVNYTQVNAYENSLLEAMKIVSSKLISSIPYDKTITCTITDDSKASEGTYVVSNGDTSFEAVSNDTSYTKGTSVLVTIPEGNYDNQKVIIGKKDIKDLKPYIYTSPMDTMLDITGNLVNDILFNEEQLNNVHENSKLVANYPKDNNGFKEQTKELYTLSNLEYTGYTRLGISADFKAWVRNAVEGEYGLKITLKEKASTTTTDSQGLAEVTKERIMLLNVSDMYGNPYEFETFYTQEKVFPLTDVNTITDIKIEFYQIGNSFKDQEGNLIPLLGAGIDGISTGLPNLFVDNIHLCLGYSTSEVTDNYIVPVMLPIPGDPDKKISSETYSDFRDGPLNAKCFDLRWIYPFEGGSRVVKPELDFGTDGQLENCEIRWYRYKLGAAAADEYCGVYWQRLNVVLEDGYYKLQEIAQNSESFGETQALNNIYFIPNIAYQTEQLKAIIILKYNEEDAEEQKKSPIVRSPIIGFRNETPKTGSEASDFINALEIYCEDGTLGNYFIYNEARELMNDTDSKVERTLSCNFAETGATAKSTLDLDITKGDSITWKFPIKNTMVELQRCGGIIQDDQVISECIAMSNVWTQKKVYDQEIEEKNAEWIITKHTNDQGAFQYYSAGLEFIINTAAEQNEEEPTVETEIVEYYINRTETSITEQNEEFDFTSGYEPWNIYKDATETYLILQNERTLWYDSSNRTNILYPVYKINAHNSMYNQNNTIACVVRKDRVVYTSEKTCNFGVAGTMGSDKTIVINFTGGHNAILCNEEGNDISYALQVTMYDEDNKPVDLSEVKIKWSWHQPNNQNENEVPSGYKYFEILNYEGANDETGEITIESGGDTIPLRFQFPQDGLTLTDKYIYIAKVSVGDDTAELETYFPIPFKVDAKYSHIDGATSIIYLSNGQPTYYKGNYQLYVTKDDNLGAPQTTQFTHDDKEYQWVILGNSKDAKYLPSVTVDGTKGISPISVYVENVKNCAIVYQLENDEQTMITQWLQPLLILRNHYPSRVINKWDGKELVLDSNQGTILTNRIAAGRKENDAHNTFTGVMIGDWKGQSPADSSITEHTGVYGFHKGAMAYAFMDDGTAFIGKSGEARIEFDTSNQHAVIKNPTNMSIDLTSGQIDAQHFKLQAGNIGTNGTPSGDKYLILQTAEDGAATNNIPNDKYKPLQIGKYFNVGWDGHLMANSADIGNWQLEAIKEPLISNTNSGYFTEGFTYYRGGRLKGKFSSVNPWEQVELDAVCNVIKGGKFIASVLESPTDTTPIKLGGSIEVYDPTKKKVVINPHKLEDLSSVSGAVEEHVNYDTSSGQSLGSGESVGVKGGTLGFMVAQTGSEIPSEFTPAGIGLEAVGGAQLKVTNQNVGMNIKSNYLFLSDHTDASGNRISMFQVKINGATPTISYDESGNPSYSTITATSELTFDGSGLKMTTGGNTARLILEGGGANGHTGIGYSDSYLALYTRSAQLVGRDQVAIKLSRSNKTLFDGSSSDLILGYAEKDEANFSTTNGCDTIIKGKSIALDNPTTISDYLVIENKVKKDTALEIAEGDIEITKGNIEIAQGIVSIDGIAIDDYPLYIESLYQTYIDGGGLHIRGLLSMTNGSTVDFTGIDQRGIRAQFG